MIRSVRSLRTAAISTALCACLATSAFAAPYGTGVVTGDTLHVRQSADSSSGILDTLLKGAQVTVLQDQTNGWYKVQLSNSTVGYMSADYLSVTASGGSSSGSASLGTGILNTDGAPLNLRSGPGSSYDVLETIPSTATLTLLSETNGWYKTTYNGVTGYVSSVYVSLGGSQSAGGSSGNLGAATLNTDGAPLNLRSGPGSSYDVLETIPSTATLTLLSETNGWYKTTYNGVTGYVSGEYVVLPGSKSASASSGSGGAATLNTDGASLNFRAAPGSDSAVLDTIPSNAILLLTGNSSNGWYETTYNGVTGYVSGSYLSLGSESIGYGILDTGGTSLNLRSGPGSSYEKLTYIPSGATLTLTGVTDGWYETTYNGVTGYVSGDYVTLSATPPAEKKTSSSSSSSSSSVSSLSSGSSSVSGTASSLVAYAKQFLGLPYVYGASGPNSFDCSGFTSYVFRQFGYSLSRSAASQYSNGVAVSSGQMQPGDLLLWRSYGSSSAATHVGIYIGNNQYIHASSTQGKITINDLSYATGTRYLVGVRRILA